MAAPVKAVSAGNFLSGLISEVMDIDVEAMGDCVGHYLRVKVVVDVSKPLKRYLRFDLSGTVRKPLRSSNDVPSPPTNIPSQNTKLAMAMQINEDEVNRPGPTLLALQDDDIGQNLEDIGDPNLVLHDNNGHALMTIKGSLSTEEAVLLPSISVPLSSTGQVGGDDETTVIKRKEKWKRWSRDSIKVEATSTHEFNGKRRPDSFPLGASSPSREGWSARHFHFQSCWAVLDECGEIILATYSLILAPIVEQVLGLAESQDLVGLLTNETPIPTKYTTSDSNTIETGNTTPQLTIEFVARQKSDRLLRGWIIKTRSEEAIGLVIGLDTTLAVWEALKDAYAHDYQEREFTLRQQLTYLRKDDDKTIGDHICIFKGLCDNLTAIGKPTPDKEKVFCLLTSL
ncbi:hypothetical protein ACOSQ3_028909 [Xanthoceras sorbifolium]